MIVAPELERPNVTPAALAMFVRFVRLNPGLSEADPLLLRVLAAYLADEAGSSS